MLFVKLFIQYEFFHFFLNVKMVIIQKKSLFLRKNLNEYEKITFLSFFILFPSLCSAQTTADIPKSEKVAVNTECKADSLRMGIQGKDIKEIDEKQGQLKRNPYAQYQNNLPLEDNKKKKKRGTGFFVQGGVGISLHK